MPKFLLLFSLSLICDSCSRPSGNESPPPRTLAQQDYKRISAILDACPAWDRIAAEDEQGAQLILDTLDPLRKERLSTLRAAITQYLSEHTDAPDNIESYCRLFILNRVLFKVPNRLRKSEYHAYGGWKGPETVRSPEFVQSIPALDRDDGPTIDPLWPCSYENGRLRLSGRYTGFNGPAYDAVGEFDYFASRFERR